MLKMNKLYLIAAWAITCFLFFETAAHANEPDEATRMTFNQSIRIPGTTLPAGTYLFKLFNSENDRNIVQVFDADGRKLYATLLTIPTARPEASDETVITLAQDPEGAPDALRKWFYPGTLTGREFVYPKQ